MVQKQEWVLSSSVHAGQDPAANSCSPSHPIVFAFAKLHNWPKSSAVIVDKCKANLMAGGNI